MMDPEVLNVLQQEPITAIAQELLDVRHKLATLPALLLQISELQSTVNELKRKNALLRDDNEDLQIQLSQSKDTANRYLEVLEAVNLGRRTFKYLPNEILRLIFLRVVPPHPLLDSSLAGGPQSPWFRALRTRKAIVMVSRQWNTVATEMMYEKVVFHRVGQISALARTLESNASLGRLIKNVEIRCFVPSGYISLIQNDLRFIFDKCPRLVRLDLHEFRSSSSTDTLQDVEPNTMRHTALSSYFIQDLSGAMSRLKHLECNNLVEFSDLVLMLQICNELQSLTFHLPEDGANMLLQSTSQIHLGHLVSLHFAIKSHTNCLQWISSHWCMPTLKHMSIRDYCNKNSGSYPRYCESFFEMYGRTLKSLHIRHIISNNNVRRVDMQYLLHSCPLLEHLVLGAQMESSTPMTHASIMWIDLWGPSNCLDLRPLLTQEAFPALRGIRELDRGLPDMIEWPLLLPPCPNIENLSFELPGLHIQDNARGICSKDIGSRDDVFTIRSTMVEDSSSDGSFAEPTDTGSDGSISDESWSSDDCDVADDMEEGDEADDWADREMTLHIFDQIME